MSSVNIITGSRKIFLYLAIILSVILINIITNRKYILKNFTANSPVQVKLDDSNVDPLIKPESYKRQIRVLTGYSIDSLLIKENIKEEFVVQSTRALRKVFDPRDLKAGAKVNILYGDIKDKGTFQGYEINLDYSKNVVVKKDLSGKFKGSIENIPYFTKVNIKNGVINSSLYQSALDEGISANVVMNLINLYSFDVDFQRDIQKGTEFEIIYENYVNEDGDVVKHGNILAAVLKFEDRRVPIYRYTSKDGKVDYYNENGKSARKALLRTPINGAYISSTYGLRRDPIQGYTAFHRGTDFAARRGTPIFASGDGVISSLIVSNKGYGIHIRIRHPNGYETMYAHMSAYARGMRKGIRVNQGQVIGYVGSTGYSTGPHLHYETRYNGRLINPSSIKIPPGRTLKGSELTNFKKEISKYVLTI